MSNQDLEDAEELIKNRLILFEGIIIGIYGNWLIALIQMISFTSYFIILQCILILISLGSLLALLSIGITAVIPNLQSRIEVVVLSCGHFIPICMTLILERLLIKDAFFLMIGTILFIMIYFAEFKRTKRRIKRHEKR